MSLKAPHFTLTRVIRESLSLFLPASLLSLSLSLCFTLSSFPLCVSVQRACLLTHSPLTAAWLRCQWNRVRLAVPTAHIFEVKICKCLSESPLTGKYKQRLWEGRELHWTRQCSGFTGCDHSFFTLIIAHNMYKFVEKILGNCSIIYNRHTADFGFKSSFRSVNHK